MDDEELIQAASAGEEFAGPFLVSLYAPMLMGYVKLRVGNWGQVACEEICVRAVERAVRRIHLLDLTKGDFATWSRAMVRYEILDHRRHNNKLDGSKDRESISPPPAPGHNFSAKEIETAFSQLSDADQAILALRSIDRLTISAAAKALGISQDAVRQRHSRARRRLADIMQSHRTTSPAEKVSKE